MGIKRRVMTLFLVFLLFGVTIFAAGQERVTEYFKFDPSRMDVGNMYHYVASDQKGKHPMDTYVYVKSLDTIVVYKDYRQILDRVIIVEGKFNWDYMMVEGLHAYNPLKDLTRPRE